MQKKYERRIRLKKIREAINTDKEKDGDASKVHSSVKI